MSSIPHFDHSVNDPNRTRSALEHVAPTDRERWLRMGMAVKQGHGDDGFPIWDAWSQKAESYNARDAQDVWRSLKPDGGITLATLFHEAKAGGWRESAPAAPVERRTETEFDSSSERAETAAKARTIWEAARPAPADNPYLSRKRESPTDTLREIDAAEAEPILGYQPKARDVPLTGRLLVVPIRQGERLSTLELIDGYGQKTALRGHGTKAGGYWATKRLPGGKGDGLTLLIGEGVATALSAAAATDYPAVAALSNTNLERVAGIMRKRYPAADLIILADLKKGSPDPDPHAVKAAGSVAGRLAVPHFAERDPNDTDFNDLAKTEGPEAVKPCIEGAAPVAPVPAVNAPAPAPGGAMMAPAPDGLIEPLPLPKLPPVPPFPIDLLPDALVDWIGDAATRARFRPDFAAVASMVALGSVIGRKVGIRLKRRDDWTEHANVWGGLIGPPSSLKSPAMRAAMRPFKALQVAADESHENEMLEYLEKAEEYKLRKDAKKASAKKALSKNPDSTIDLGDLDEPEKPTPRTYWTSDATAERLGELLAENPHGLLVERDELSSLLVTLEDERSATARGFYLSGWSGQEGYRFDRIIRGKTYIPKFALSVIGGIQPGPLSRYVRGAFSGERADGLLQRFQLLVWPDPEAFDYVDRYPDSDARKAAIALFERADTFNPAAVGNRGDFGNDPPFVRLADDAQALFIEWYTEFMQNRRSVESDGSECAPIAAHFGKYPGLVGKIALILHVANDPTAGEVSKLTLMKALAWIQYLEPHARRVYHAVEHPETGAAELLIARIRRGELPAMFKAWEISRKGWHGLTDRETAKKACRLLFEFGWLILIDAGGPTGGRPADPVYAVSPMVKVPA